MKNFTFIDLDGKSHCLPPSFFASSPYIEGLDFLYPLSDSVKSDLSEYAVKAYNYIKFRRVKSDFARKVYSDLSRKISFLSSCGFPDVPLYKVLDAFSDAYTFFPVYRHHVAFCRGYVSSADRDNPPLEPYFGTFGGGYAFYTYFSTRYRYRHLLLLSSWWFCDGDVFSGVNKSRLALFEKFCKYGELPISS